MAKAKKSRLTRLPGDARQSNCKSRLECRKQMRASEGKKVCNLSAQAHYSGYTNLTRGPASRLSTSKYFKFQIALSRPVRYFLSAGATRFKGSSPRPYSGLRGVLSLIDRYGADSKSRKSALSALYLAAGSAAFRTLHDDRPFGCADAPPPCSAALRQGQFKNRKLIHA